LIKNFYNYNWFFIFIVSVIAIIGFIALYSAADANLDLWARKQIIRFVFGLILLFIISVIDIKFWYKNINTIFLLSLALLVSVEVFGIFGFGARRWIKIFNISIQPSEFIKITLILFLAKYYNEIKFEKIYMLRNLIIPIFAIFIPAILVLFQPDLGTALTIVALGLMILFISGVKIWKFVLAFFAMLISLPLIWKFVLKDYQIKRILSFINPESDLLGSGYHLYQSKIALGSGGFYGKGYLKGSQSYLDFLPEKQTDFIFTLIGEEFGFIGTIFVLVLYLILILNTFYIGFKAFNVFSRIVAIGVGTNLFLYVICNSAMVTGLLPVVGVPLPLISYGGSVMISIMISFGFLMNVNVYQFRKKI